MKEFFRVKASKYVPGKEFDIVRPASLNNPKDNAVMFIMEKYMNHADAFANVKNCLIFWPDSIAVPAELEEKHAVVKSREPHTDYCRFFADNDITYLPEKEKVDVVDGAYISPRATIGSSCTIMPGAYIGGECILGDHVYIGCGTKLMGRVSCGNNVVIRENTVIGADGLTTDRDRTGKAITMPQFGDVIIEDNVQIGANTVVARGAIDSTVIKNGAKIDSQCFISHNTVIGEDSFIVGETIMFGSSSVGKRCLISGNCTIANMVHIGDDTILGMSATALKDVPSNVIAFGSPVNVVKER